MKRFCLHDDRTPNPRQVKSFGCQEHKSTLLAADCCEEIGRLLAPFAICAPRGRALLLLSRHLDTGSVSLLPSSSCCFLEESNRQGHLAQSTAYRTTCNKCLVGADQAFKDKSSVSRFSCTSSHSASENHTSFLLHPYSPFTSSSYRSRPRLLCRA